MPRPMCRPKDLFNPWVDEPWKVKDEDLDAALLKRQDPNLCMKYVKENCWALECVRGRYQTEEMCLEAVKQSGRSLRHAKIKTEAVVRAAIENDPLALEYVEEQTPDLCYLAVNRNGLTLDFVQETFKTRELCLLAVQKHGCALEYVPLEMRDDEMCETAVRNFPFAIQYCPNKTAKLVRLALEIMPEMKGFFTGIIELPGMPPININRLLSKN